MSNVKPMPTTGHANCNEDVANFLREMADNVESGKYGTIRQLVVNIEAGGEIETWVAGGPCDNARIIGLMSIASMRFMHNV